MSTPTRTTPGPPPTNATSTDSPSPSSPSPTPRVSGQWPGFRPPSIDAPAASRRTRNSSGANSIDSTDASPDHHVTSPSTHGNFITRMLSPAPQPTPEDRPQLWPPPSMILMDGLGSRSSRSSRKSTAGTSPEDPAPQKRSRSQPRPKSFQFGPSKRTSSSGTSSPDPAARDPGPVIPLSASRGQENAMSGELEHLMALNNRGSLSVQRAAADHAPTKEERELQRLVDMNNRRSLSTQRASMDNHRPATHEEDAPGSVLRTSVTGTPPRAASPQPAALFNRRSVGPASPRIDVHSPALPAESPAPPTDDDLLKLLEKNGRGQLSQQRSGVDVAAAASEKEIQRILDAANRLSIDSQRAAAPTEERRASFRPPAHLAAPTSVMSQSVEGEIDALMDRNNRGSLGNQRAGPGLSQSAKAEAELERLVGLTGRGSLDNQRGEAPAAVPRDVVGELEKLVAGSARGSLEVQRASVGVRSEVGKEKWGPTSSPTRLAAEEPLTSPVSELRSAILRDIHTSLAASPTTPTAAPSPPTRSAPGSPPTRSAPGSPGRPPPLPREGSPPPPDAPSVPPVSPFALPGESRADRIALLVRQHKESSRDAVTGVTVIPRRTASMGVGLEDGDPATPATPGAESSVGASPVENVELGLPPSGGFGREAVAGKETVASPKEETPVTPAAPVDYKSLPPAEVASRLFHLSLPGVGKDKVCQIVGKGDEFHAQVLHHYMEMYEFYGMTLDSAFRHLCAHLYLTGETQMVDRILYRFSKRTPGKDIVYGILFSLVLLNTDLHIANAGTARKMQRKTFVKNTSDLIDKMITDDDAVRDAIAGLGSDGAKRWKRDIENLLKDLYTSVKDNRILQRPGDPNPADAHRSASPDHAGFGGAGILRRSNSVGRKTLKTSRSSFLPTTGSLSSPGGLMAGGGGSPTSGVGTFLRGTAAAAFAAASSAAAGERKASDPGAPSAAAAAAAAQGLSAESLKESRYSLGSHGSLGGSGQILSSADNSVASISNLRDGVDSTRTTPTSVGPGSVGSPAGPVRRPSFSSESSGGGGGGALGVGPFGMGAGGAAGGSTVFNGREGVTLEGLMIRKHLTDHNETRARNRRWAKVWCVMAIDDERGVELTMFKVDPGVGDGEINFDDREVGDYGRPLPGDENGGSSQDLERKSSDSGPVKKVLRIANQPPVVFNLLHSIATPLKSPGYSPSRPFVFSLLLNNNSSHLFQCPTPEAVVEWTRTLNYWAARRSKEPLRGAISSADYGWNFAAEERRRRERLEEAGVATGPGSANSSAGSVAEGAGGSEGALESPTSSPWSARKNKVEDWTPPSGTGMMVSALSEEMQLASMRRQVDALSKDLEEHASYKKPMERQYAFNLSLKSKALANWHRRQKYLTLEYDRYSTYVQVLRTSVTEKQRRLLDDFSTGAGDAGAMSDGEGYGFRKGSLGRNVRGRRKVGRASFSTMDSVSSAEGEEGDVLAGLKE
ncbi:hypothetical protein HDU96_007481 [Phlyctochytrium bullatum]|nr:hypothetical protein HDU96_007481 [Phlyctochytrium bullatum]